MTKVFLFSISHFILFYFIFSLWDSSPSRHTRQTDQETRDRSCQSSYLITLRSLSIIKPQNISNHLMKCQLYKTKSDDFGVGPGQFDK